MRYTAQNIDNIKRAGNLDAYIAHAREMISKLEAAEIETGEQGADTISFAHLYGRVGIDVEVGHPSAFASISYGEWTKNWSLASFDNDQARGLAYARAALKNKLVEDGKLLLSQFRADLAQLEAA